MFWVLLVLCGLVVGLIMAVVAGVRYFQSYLAVKELEMRSVIDDWTISPDSNTPSKLAQVTQLMGTVMGQAAAKSIMGAVNAQDAAIAKMANMASDEIEAAQNPLLALVKQGRKGKGSALERLAELMGPQIIQAIGGPGNGHATESEYIPRRRR